MAYDCIIVGGGCAGLPAAMYAARMNLKTLLFAEIPGGLITTTHVVENWPGIISTSGPELAEMLWKHAKAVGVEMKNELVKSAQRQTATAGSYGCFEVETGKGKYLGKTLVLATGSYHKELDAPGEKELKNRGVSYCALCDGAFFRGKVVAVVGGGDSAAKEALFLGEQCSKVYLLARGDVLKAEPVNIEAMKKKPKIEIMYREEVAEVIGKDKVEGVRLKSGKELKVDGVFVAIGQVPRTELAKELGVQLNEKGEIIIDRQSQTNVPGVYGAGDCTDTRFKQAITGAAEGVTAAFYAFTFLQGCND